ncbi:MAG: insulinase family protein [Comamonadaceae bacterium]|nr:insulinase family protein [Comamonadaceae bacterium]
MAGGRLSADEVAAHDLRGGRAPTASTCFTHPQILPTGAACASTTSLAAAQTRADPYRGAGRSRRTSAWRTCAPRAWRQELRRPVLRSGASSAAGRRRPRGLGVRGSRCDEFAESSSPLDARAVASSHAQSPSRVAASLAAALAGARSAGAGRSLPAGVEQAPAVEGVTEYRLANGLQVLLYPDPSKPTVTVNITYLVGSRHENYGETGMAHLLEHLIFKGTQEPPEPGQGVQPARLPQQRHHLRSTAPTTSRPSRPATTTCAGRSSWKADAMVNSFIAQEGPRLRDDGGAQRVRDGREQPVPACCSSACSRVTFDWHNYGNSADRQPQRHRERAASRTCRRSTGRTTSRTTPCCTVAGKFDEARRSR